MRGFDNYAKDKVRAYNCQLSFKWSLKHFSKYDL